MPLNNLINKIHVITTLFNMLYCCIIILQIRINLSIKIVSTSKFMIEYIQKHSSISNYANRQNNTPHQQRATHLPSPIHRSQSPFPGQSPPKISLTVQQAKEDERHKSPLSLSLSL